MGPIKLGRLLRCNPRLDVNRVRILQAMYRGGHHLLGNHEIMKQVFPQYTYEQPQVYAERTRRAFYENMFALVINQISAGLAQDPVRLSIEQEVVEEEVPVEPSDDPWAEEDEDKPAKKLFGVKPPPNKPLTKKINKIVDQDVDPYWSDLIENATALEEEGTHYRSLDQVIRDVAVEALVCGWSWVQCDLPRKNPDDPAPTTLKDQEDSGDLRAYLVPWPTDCVTDWEEKDGRLLWVRTYMCEQIALTPDANRDSKKHIWTIWDATGWYKYEFLQEKNQTLPGDETDIPLADEGKHSFKRVPWTKFDVSCRHGSHLHVGDLIESLCRNYFNRQNGESFQWVQFYYQQLYEFLAPEVAGIDTPISEAQQDPNRARRVRAPGMVHVRGAEDRAEFVGPDMSGAEVGRNAMQDLRDAVLRVVSQMALAQDTSGAMLRRSAASKKQDAVAQEIVLGAIGKLLIALTNHLACLLAAGREDTEEPPRFVGYERFDVTDASQLIEQSVLVEGISIPSATYQVEQKYQLACAHLGDKATPEVQKKIKEELMLAITQDQLMNAGPTEDDNPFGEEDEDEESEDSEDEEEEESEDEYE